MLWYMIAVGFVFSRTDSEGGSASNEYRIKKWNGI